MILSVVLGACLLSYQFSSFSKSFFAHHKAQKTQKIFADPIQDGVLQNRKIVLTGDYILQKEFLKFAFMTKSADLWENEDSYVKDDMVGWTIKETYPDARFNLKEDLGEFFFAPGAGKFARYKSSIQKVKVRQDIEDWFVQCSMRLPFHLMAMSFISANQESETSVRKFEKILLTEVDIVVFYPGIDPETQEKNIRSYHRLQRCIEEAKEVNEGASWPHIIYLKPDEEVHAEGILGKMYDISLNAGSV